MDLYRDQQAVCQDILDGHAAAAPLVAEKGQMAHGTDDGNCDLFWYAHPSLLDLAEVSTMRRHMDQHGHVDPDARGVGAAMVALHDRRLRRDEVQSSLPPPVEVDGEAAIPGPRIAS